MSRKLPVYLGGFRWRMPSGRIFEVKPGDAVTFNGSSVRLRVVQSVVSGSETGSNLQSTGELTHGKQTVQGGEPTD